MACAAIFSSSSLLPDTSAGFHVSVNPAPASSFMVTAPASATAGSSFSFSVTAQDPFNNTATGYTGMVHFTSGDAQGLVRIGELPPGDRFVMEDQLADRSYRWTRADLGKGLYVRLKSGDAHLFLMKPD